MSIRSWAGELFRGIGNKLADAAQAPSTKGQLKEVRDRLKDVSTQLGQVKPQYEKAVADLNATDLKPELTVFGQQLSDIEGQIRELDLRLTDAEQQAPA